MEIVYKAFDGKCFSTEQSCIEYERTVLHDSIIMVNPFGERTYETCTAMMVWLRDMNASRAFLRMAEEQGDHDCRGIEADDYGMFYWDDSVSEYRWVDNDLFRSFSALVKLVNEKKQGKEEVKEENYYEYEVTNPDGAVCTSKVEFANTNTLMNTVSKAIAFADCTDERVTKIVYKGIEIHYTGWQPGNVMEYADANGNIVWSGCFPQWDH